MKNVLDECASNAHTNATLSRAFSTAVTLYCADIRSKDMETEADVASRLGVIYMATLFVGVIVFQSAIPPGGKERIVFYREQVRKTRLVLSLPLTY